MPRFQRRLDCDTGYVDAQLFINVQKFLTASGAAPTATFPAAGRPAATIAAAVTFDIPLGEILRTGVSDDLQEAFGGGAVAGVFAGARGNASPPAVFSTPAGVSGAPPFTGITQLTPVTVARPKGINITSVAPIFSPTAAVTSTIAVYATPFVSNAVPVTASLLAPTAVVGTIQANPRVAATQVLSGYIVTPLTEVVIEWVISAATSATIYGLVVGVTYNWN